MRSESIATLNCCGRTSDSPNEYAQKFIDFASPENSPVLDIGAAFGVATLPALAKGAIVLANDIDIRHLEILSRGLHGPEQGNLRLVHGAFPSQFDVEEGSLAAVLASNVLNFLRGSEITRGAEAIHSWLRPGGRAFIIAGTPYAGNVKGFIPVYEARRAHGHEWPGECTDIREYSDDPTTEELPRFLHLLDDTVLRRTFEKAGFEIEDARMFLRAGLPDYLKCDGRENVGLVAFKRG